MQLVPLHPGAPGNHGGGAGAAAEALQPHDRARLLAPAALRRGGAVYKFNPLDPELESAWFQPRKRLVSSLEPET